MNYAICTVAAAPVRKEDAHRSEMINQLLFGEPVQVLETKAEWVRIQSLYDGYEGWLTEHLITPVDEKTAAQPCPFVATALVNPVTLPDELVNVPMGASLTGLDEETRLLWDDQHRYHGTYRDVTEPLDIDLLWRSVQAWINAPYLWGGRTFMGVDCSGFVQVVYKVLGIALKRDAYQQAEQGTVVNSLQEARVGDIAFFENKEGRVVHVGILLGEGQIAHASGKVRIDRIDEEGITNVTNGKRSHQMHSIRRFMQMPV
jgi:gamma-D-glutamyl-L-lysine dipeptidyl-peptidase